MATDRTRDSIAALEQARAQIETVLGGNADWLALRRVAAGSSRLAHELAFAANPLYRSWKLLNEAIGDLQAKEAQPHAVQPGAVPDDLTRIRGISADLARRLADHGITRYGQIAAWRADDVRSVADALGLGRRISRQNWIEQAALLEERRSAAEPAATPARAELPAARAQAQSIGLHHILRHIRDSAAQTGDAPSAARAAPAAAAAATDDARGHGAAGAAQQEPEERQVEAVDGAPGWEEEDGLAPEPEEASVTFVIREPVEAASADDRAAEGDAQDGPLSDQWAAVGADDALYPPTGGEVEEAEVVIVSRPSHRRSRKK